MKSYEAKALIARHEESAAILQGIVDMHRKAEVAKENIATYNELCCWHRSSEENRLDTIQSAIKRLEQRYHKSIHKIIEQ
jgi:hypothetical protein